MLHIETEVLLNHICSECGEYLSVKDYKNSIGTGITEIEVIPCIYCMSFKKGGINENML